MTEDLELRPLVIEDDPDILNLVRLYLNKLGYDPVCVSDPQAALGEFQKHRYRLVLLDWNLPGMTGIDITRYLRRHVSHADTYIIMITTQAQPAEISRALEAGVDDYLIKPVTPELLRVRVQIAEQRLRLAGVGSVRARKESPAGNPVSFSAPDTSDVALENLRNAHRRTENSLILNRYYDPLTGLANRSLMIEILDSHLHQLRSLADYSFGVVCLDLKRFNLINDSLGYETGDMLLIRVARRIESILFNHDVLSRPGADRFVIMLTELKAGEDASALLDDLKKTFREPFRMDDQEIFLDFAAGVVMAEREYVRAEDLLRAAETALHDAKQNSVTGIQYFSDFMQTRAQIKLQLEGELRRALQNMDFEVNYQPIVSAREGRVMGVEALIRWRHPEFGEISPGQFVPIAEETGMIDPITRWVLETACRQMRGLVLDSAEETPYVSVNIASQLFLDDHLTEMIQSALDASGLSPGSLVLEVTETSAMKFPRKTRQILERLLDLGVRVSIDDFGTGYSSLAYLRQFPVQYLKIDRSFLKEVESNRNNAAIAGAIIALAGAMDLAVIAEGVENPAQIDFLARHNCDFMQGFYFSRPVPLSELPAAFARIREMLVVAPVSGVFAQI